MSNLAVRLEGVGKKYTTFPSKLDNLLDGLGLATRFGSKTRRGQDFWAVRGLDLTIERGERLGVIGRNGAGKSTLIKLVVGLTAANEGSVNLYEPVQALLETGGGFNMELSGADNTRSSLVLRGVAGSELERYLAEVEEFCELGDFFHKPIRTYSSGMQARLAFAVATAIPKPSLLVIDEVLGAGDPYFLAKCQERLQALFTSETSLLLVSHSMDHVVRLCDRAVWIDRGAVVAQGAPMEVVKEYQEFMRSLEDRRLRLKNDSRNAAVADHAFTETLILDLAAPAEADCRVSGVSLRRDGRDEDSVVIGGPQDGDGSHSGFVLLGAGGWSDPLNLAGRACRRVIDESSGRVAFNLFSLRAESDYAFSISYAARQEVVASVHRNGVQLSSQVIPATTDWTESVVHFSVPAEKEGTERTPDTTQRRWPGEGGLRITNVEFMGDGVSSATFLAGQRVTMRVGLQADREGQFTMIPTAVLYRMDGVLVTRYIGEAIELSARAQQGFTVELDLGPLRFGNGHYVVTAALYRTLDITGATPSPFYDLLDRSFTFAVIGHAPLVDGVIVESRPWRMIASPDPAPPTPSH